MAEMLTYRDSRSTAALYKRSNLVEFADENYAREIMQLFSIVTHQLNNDGSKVIGEDGQPILTYTNDEVSEYARVWTGFRRQESRGNIETTWGRKFLKRSVLMLSPIF